MAASKRVLYVGGLAEEVDEKVLHAAFIPFGDIIDIQIPLDYETEKHRGFGFIEFELPEDAAAAIDNMNESELFGRTIRVNIAKPMRIKEGSSRPVWSDDDWLKKFSGKTVEEAEAEAASGEAATTTQEKTFAACAHMKRALATRAAASIALSLSSCAKEETSPTTTALGASPSTAESLMTRTSSSNTRLQGSSPWPTLDPTLTDPSSSSPQTKQTGWMGNTWCLENWWRGWMCCVQWKLRE
ncbi:peptidyl-prolyl cis-trans isomerase E isoform X2 [Girardinichthys multiradiatus]|uniref:peptidyl-prolyl cis-trans isomerase E isoform X2 n=1 Tax=Girardinichthys multiradiatus TaxID=208333 RepID=UPI001FAE0599|nr:peptidyl-prolyl cis-trans isomerase E isoform X2 [Girardinichthys multiradiatus]